ncbi:MAG: hypothetical protein NT047_11350 [Deltaproteobacteria bacterium]|nr:hypothetical protein [Deltaproteobacteria bacterium]
MIGGSGEHHNGPTWQSDPGRQRSGGDRPAPGAGAGGGAGRASEPAAAATGLPVVFQVGHTGRGRNRWTTIDILLAEAQGIYLIMPFGKSSHEDTARIVRHLCSHKR